MPHHGGIIGEIEDEIIQIERMALSGRGLSQQPGAYMQQPMGYGQGMYGAYGPPPMAVPYAQPAYAMRSAYAAVPPPVVYGPGYVDAGDGRPAMVFGGAYEGGALPAAGYRSAYQQAPYQTQYPSQGYPAPLQPAYSQAYPPASQPGYAQPPPLAPQYSAAPQASQPAPQYATAPQAPQPAPQYATPPQASQPAPQYAAAPQSSQPVPQYAAAPQPPQSAAQGVPTTQAPQPAPQYSGTPQSTQPPYGGVSPSPQPVSQYANTSPAPQTPQSPPAATQSPLPAPQYPAAAPSPQPAPQYGSSPQNAQPAPQYAVSSQSPQPQYPGAPQSNQTSLQATPQYPPSSQSSPQPAYASQAPPGIQSGTQPAPQPSTQYLQGDQSAVPPAYQYPPSSQPFSQSQYPQNALATSQTSYGPRVGDRGQYDATATAADVRSGPASIGLVAAAAGAASLGYVAYERHQQHQQYQHQQAVAQQYQTPAYLSPQDTTVRFDPVSKSVDTHHHAMKALSHSNHSVAELSAIIGTYLVAKHMDKGHVWGMTSSRPEVKDYYHHMDKLEKLSVDYIGKHHSSTQSWKTALGPHRRQIFAELYNKNELVRGFCQEMQGGPLALPDLDSYSLGTKLTSFNFARLAFRGPNLQSSLSILARVRTVILVDDSYSMTEAGHPSWSFRRNESRWTQTRNLLAGISPLVAAHSPHGVDLHFLNRKDYYAGLRTTQAVHSAFDSDRPNNGTPTGARVNDILDAYVSTLRYYRALLPLNLIVITDGEAQDESLLHRAIEHHVTELVHRGFPPHQFGVEFVQVGDCEHATRHLERLEKEVSRHHHRFQRDVVGVTPANRITNMDPDAMLAIAVSGIDARINGYMRSRGINV